jgi:selenide,water dikinase
MSTSDDAGVFRISDDVALVQTVDFFTPVVDDPYTWGAIAAANSLSDVYAMGGTPITALNVAAFPLKEFPVSVIGDVLRGSSDKCVEAGVAVLGGHTVDDPQPKFGLSVTGTVHPDRIVTNAGARVGDVLILTKPLGLGITNSAIKMELVTPEQYELAVRVMTTLNRAASVAMMSVGVNACTDITGFGFLGHLAEMCAGAGIGAEVSFASLPLLPGLAELRERGATTRAPKQIYEFLGARVVLSDGLDKLQREILADPQTSGGLLISLPASHESLLHDALLREGVEGARTVGRLVAGETIRVS